MRPTFFQLFCSLIAVALILSACNLPVNNATAEAATSTEQIADVTATVDLAATQTMQAELLPTETPSATATETPIPEPSMTATMEVPKAEVVRETNCRIGPAGNYELVAKYPVGQKLDVVAQDLGSAYWFVQNPEKPEEQCYLLAQNIKVTGDTSVLPKFTPLPSPTAMPYFTMSFKKFDTCKGSDFAAFIVENTGSVPFRSAYVKFTDLKLNKSVETALNAFDQHVGCVLAKNVAPLNQGETGYVETPPITWSTRGHKQRVVIMLCTEQNLKGTCVTQTMDMKE
jgi:hypothetical protein